MPALGNGWAADVGAGCSLAAVLRDTGRTGEQSREARGSGHEVGQGYGLAL